MASLDKIALLTGSIQHNFSTSMLLYLILLSSVLFHKKKYEAGNNWCVGIITQKTMNKEAVMRKGLGTQ